MADYTFQSFDGYGSDIHNYKIVIAAAVLLIWVLKLLVRYVKFSELFKGYRSKNVSIAHKHHNTCFIAIGETTPHRPHSHHADCCYRIAFEFGKPSYT